MTTERLSTKTVTPKHRVHYQNVHTPQKQTNSDGVQQDIYNYLMAFEKSVDLKDMMHKADNAGMNKFGKEQYLKLKKAGKIHWPFKNGDDKEDEQFNGQILLSAKSTTKPGIVEKDPHSGEYIELLNSNDFYSGCYCIATVNFYAYEFKGKKGVSAGLHNICKVDDGGRLSGIPSALSDFASFDSKDDGLDDPLA